MDNQFVHEIRKDNLWIRHNVDISKSNSNKIMKVLDHAEPVLDYSFAISLYYYLVPRCSATYYPLTSLPGVSFIPPCLILPASTAPYHLVDPKKPSVATDGKGMKDENVPSG